MSTSRSVHTITLAAALALLALLPASSALAEFPPKKAENLKVLPADTDVRQVIGVMRGFATGLGVRCEHCHVGEPGQPLDTFDFASDEKEAKRTARVMMRMVDSINKEHLAELSNERREVQCITCHHGLDRPDTLAAALTRAHAESGAEGAVAEYRRLREEHYGSAAYDFTEWKLLGVAETLAGGGDPEAAEAMIDLNLEHFPDSPTTQMFRARFYGFQGKTEQAVEILEGLIAADPENANAKRMLEQMQKPTP